ncbi:ATP-binding protein [Desulfonatronum sp. SC1]|uniref:ATP-binding protein n=1 Tax=Desulfonatronum sp. SC1 TaxID=2109626 RepID=UPI000D32156A|nr:ATP-binding protein [Desulfonatronum sp. SC1]PTN33031.1 hypothetical protein C6366_15430 [Desulfonatronum sp. SC1]
MERSPHTARRPLTFLAAVKCGDCSQLVDNFQHGKTSPTPFLRKKSVNLFRQQYEPSRPLEQIFVDFYSEKGRYHTGMGLGIAKKLVEERMGGSIEVENIEQGARFTVRIPRKGGPRK